MFESLSDRLGSIFERLRGPSANALRILDLPRRRSTPQ